MDELEGDAGVIELDGELVEFSLVSNSESDGESALRQVAGRRLTGSMDELGSLGSDGEIPAHDTVVDERVLRNDCGLATSCLNGSRACTHHKLVEESVK